MPLENSGPRRRRARSGAAAADRRADDFDPQEFVERQQAKEQRARERAEREADPYAMARTIVLNRLNAAPRTRAELQETLDKRGIPQDVAEQVLDRMTEVNLIDDAAYARAWVTSRQAGRGLARRALKLELHRKGIDPELAADALDLVDDDTERETAQQLVQRKLRTVAGLPRDKQVRRLAGMLARKGYSAGVAFSVVNEALNDESLNSDDELGDLPD